MVAHTLKNSRVGVIGLGYVGMPLAVMLAKHVPTTGFDIFQSRVQELNDGWDSNRETKEEDLHTTRCQFTNNPADLESCNTYIVTVPTPLDADNNPDLGAVKSASKTISSYLKKGDIVVYESTVYPGVTEDICGPILEEGSGLVCGKHFFLGYSPERINPGDTKHTVENITKVVSAQTPEMTDFLAELYGSVNGGKIFKAKNIRTAEASKAIENAQRDINVAFVNEVTMILNKLGLSAYDVLEAACTKWNFLNFHPGLVGGHCIGVDPYYLAFCAEKAGHTPEVILSGRKTNDAMGLFVADNIHDIAIKNLKTKTALRILLLGFTFKEGINDIRNTKVIDIYNSLKEKGCEVDVHDPYARPKDVKKEYGINLLQSLPIEEEYDCVSLIVGHQTYKDMAPVTISSLIKKHGIVYDLKGTWRELSFDSDIKYHSL